MPKDYFPCLLFGSGTEADALDTADNKPNYERRKALRQEKAYPEIKKFETWMEVNILKCPPKSLMEEAISYTYKILKKTVALRHRRPLQDRRQYGGEQHQASGHRAQELSVLR